MLPADRIKERREELELTQEQCVETAIVIDPHFTQSQWSAYESGETPNPSVQKMGVVAAVLKCTIDDLMHDSDSGTDDTLPVSPLIPSPAIPSDFPPDEVSLLTEYRKRREQIFAAAINKELAQLPNTLRDRFDALRALIKQKPRKVQKKPNNS